MSDPLPPLRCESILRKSFFLIKTNKKKKKPKLSQHRADRKNARCKIVPRPQSRTRRVVYTYWRVIMIGEKYNIKNSSNKNNITAESSTVARDVYARSRVCVCLWGCSPFTLDGHTMLTQSVVLPNPLPSASWTTSLPFRRRAYTRSILRRIMVPIYTSIERRSKSMDINILLLLPLPLGLSHSYFYYHHFIYVASTAVLQNARDHVERKICSLIYSSVKKYRWLPQDFLLRGGVLGHEKQYYSPFVRKII